MAQVEGSGTGATAVTLNCVKLKVSKILSVSTVA